jgi:hypothetical protein
MEIVLILLQLFGELLLQVLGESLVQLICHGLSKLLGGSSHPALFPARVDRPAPTHPVVAACGYGLMGGFVGGLTLLMLPTALVQHPVLRSLNLFFSPVLVGLLVVMLGQRQQNAKPPHLRPIDHRSPRQSPDQKTPEIYSFACGFAFAFAIALVRYLWAR